MVEKVGERMNDAVFSSKSIEWETPQAFFDALNRRFGFSLDVCATRETAKCPHFFDKSMNGLAQSWANHRCYMNPPYGREIGPWVEKARREAERGALVVGLLPARTDTAWFHEHVYRAATEIRFLKGRLKFEGAAASAPFPSMIAVWGKV